jgi:hypothetical protein
MMKTVAKYEMTQWKKRNDKPSWNERLGNWKSLNDQYSNQKAANLKKLILLSNEILSYYDTIVSGWRS